MRAPISECAFGHLPARGTDLESRLSELDLPANAPARNEHRSSFRPGGDARRGRSDPPGFVAVDKLLRRAIRLHSDPRAPAPDLLVRMDSRRLLRRIRRIPEPRSARPSGAGGLYTVSRSWNGLFAARSGGARRRGELHL